VQYGSPMFFSQAKRNQIDNSITLLHSASVTALAEVGAYQGKLNVLLMFFISTAGGVSFGFSGLLEFILALLVLQVLAFFPGFLIGSD